MNNFDIYPAIDIKNGKCVRLLHGDINKITIYENDPLKQVDSFVQQGCEWLHIVDLNAALGMENNEQIINDIIKNFNKKIKIQLGGGIRSNKKIKSWIDRGISRVVVGTLAYQNPDKINNLEKAYHKKIGIAIDIKNNMIAINGWQRKVNLTPIELINRIDKSFINSIVYTDVSKDGTLQGVDVKQVQKFCQLVSLPVIASGGVSTIEDIKKLFYLKNFGLSGIIIGKAIYENKININDIAKIVYG